MTEEPQYVPTAAVLCYRCEFPVEIEGRTLPVDCPICNESIGKENLESVEPLVRRQEILELIGQKIEEKEYVASLRDDDRVIDALYELREEVGE